jgi:multidrug efflux pump
VVCAVFVPVMFLAGQTGLLFRELAVAMIATVALSGFLALSLDADAVLEASLPARGTRQVSPRVDRDARADEPLIRRLARRGHGALAGTCVAAPRVLVAARGWSFTQLDSELGPALGHRNHRHPPVGARRAPATPSSDATGRRPRRAVLPLVGDGPGARHDRALPLGQRRSEDFNAANLNIFLRHWDEREQTSDDVVRQVNRALAQIAAVRGNATVRSSLGRGRGQPINFVIAGHFVRRPRRGARPDHGGGARQSRDRQPRCRLRRDQAADADRHRSASARATSASRSTTSARRCNR